MKDLILIKDIPNLSEQFEPATIDLASAYWTPEGEETKRLIFMGVDVHQVPDFNDKTKLAELKCVVFVSPDPEGAHQKIVNGSKRLVGIFENNQIEKGSPVQVGYKGKKKGKNGNMGDTWSVQILKEKGKK